MTRRRQLSPLLGACLAGTMLSGCASVDKFNPFLLIDDPLVRSSDQGSAVQQEIEPETPAQLATPTDTPPPAASVQPLAAPAEEEGDDAQEPGLIGPVLPAAEMEQLAASAGTQTLQFELPPTPPSEAPALVAPVGTEEEPEAGLSVADAFADLVQEEAIPAGQEPIAEEEEDQLALALPQTAAPLPTPRIGDDFLLPEPAAEDSTELAANVTAPAPEALSPPAPAPQSVGPVLEEEEPVQLATSLPSAFDFVAEEIETEVETPEPSFAPSQPPALEEPEALALQQEQLVPAQSAPDPFEPIFEESLSLAPAPVEEELPPVAQAGFEEAPPALAELPQAGQPSAAPAAEEVSQLEREAEALGLSVVTALPTPGSAPGQLPGQLPEAPRGASYREFYDFALAKLELLPAGGGRESMLLLDPPSLDPALQRCGNLPPAVLVDLDPANGLLPLVSSNRPNPELAGYLAVLRQRGVTVYWISGHGPGAARSIRERLQQSALDPAGNDPLVVTRFAGESKQERRYALGETNCLLAILGDHRADFDELYDFVLDPIMAGPLEVHINQGWFIAPPPLD